MTLTLISGFEPAVGALIGRLNSGDEHAQPLSAYLAAVNALVSDGATIENPAVVLDYIPPIDQVYDFPTIGVGHLPGRMQDDTGYSATGVYDLAVCVFLQDADQQALTRKVRRYERALRSCLIEGRTWGGSPTGVPWGVQHKLSDPGGTLADRPSANQPPNTFLTWMTVVVTVKCEEIDV